MSISIALGVLVVCFLILLKSAGWFVDGAVGVAEHLNVPKMLIGIVLVSLATTAPEMAVSVLSAMEGHAEMALGNAVGSVIVNGGVALGLGALMASTPIPVNPHILKHTGIFLVAIILIAYAMAFDGTLGRVGGGVLLLLLGCAAFLYWYRTRRRPSETEAIRMEELSEIEEAVAGRSLRVLMLWFGVGLAGVLLSSEGIVRSAVVIAQFLGIREVVVALTVVAIGTSLPEIATGVAAARKGHGEIMVGDILGANILNICWVAGGSALVNPLIVARGVIQFSFPAMLVIVGSMLIMMRTRHRLGRAEGGILLVLYGVYLVLMVKLFV